MVDSSINTTDITTPVEEVSGTVAQGITQAQAESLLSPDVKMYDVGTNDEKKNLADMFNVNTYVTLGRYVEGNKTVTTSAMSTIDGVLVKVTSEAKDTSGNTKFVSDGLYYIRSAKIYSKIYNDTVIYQILGGV